jgi:hypothetical protein
MAAASYTTDLTDFEDFEAASTVTEALGYNNTRAFEDQDGDNPIQGTQHASAEQRTTGAGSILSSGTGTTLAAGEAFFFWQNFLQAGAVDTFANDGIVGIVGTGTQNFYRWTIGGSGFGRNPYGGWANQVCDPTIGTGRFQQGNPGTSYSVVGFGCNVITAISKGSPYNLDAIRYGRGEVLVTDGDLANGYATFEGISAQNDTQTNRWGLFQFQAGSYLWKGLLSLGTTTAVDFRDANRVIVIDNTLVVSSSFNRIEVNNTASNVDWNAINISSLGTVSRGQFEMIDGATLEFNTCVFTDMDTFIFNKGTGKCDLLNNTWRRCRTVTQGGATIDSCVFDSTTADSALVSTVTTANSISECNFVGDGTSHAVQLGSVTSSIGITWNSTHTGYAGTSAGPSASSTSGDSETILVSVASGQTLTISVGGIGVAPTVRNTGAGTVSIVSSKILTVNNILVGTELRLYSYTDINDPNTYTELAGIESIGTVTGGDSGFTTPVLANGVYSTTLSYDTAAGDIPVILVAHALTSEFFRETLTLSSTENTSFTVFQIGDRQYNPGSV